MERPVLAKSSYRIEKKSPPWDAPAKRPNVSSCIVNVLRSRFTVARIVDAIFVKIQRNVKTSDKKLFEIFCHEILRPLIRNSKRPFPTRLRRNCLINWAANVGRVPV